MSAMLSPTAGVGARDRSTMPKGTPSLLEASLATNWPTLVTLNEVFFIVSHRTSKSPSLTWDTAVLTTPGPLTPTFMTASVSVTPWNAPAMNGLSSGGLQNITSFVQPMESLSAVLSAVRFMTSPMSLTASMFIPIFVVATSTDPQTLSVLPRASGIESISILSDRVMPFATNAEYPPMKLIPIFLAALSKVCAMVTKSSGVLHAEEPTMLMGVTETLLLTMGIPYSRLMSSATGIRSRAVLTILS